MQRTFRPIAGFGPWGWALLPVALALAYCALGGYDLRLAIFQWWYDRFGWKSLTSLIYEWLFPYHGSLWGPVFGPLTLIPVLLGMYLSPRRWQPLTWIIVSMWMLANPALTWMIYHYLERYYPAGPAFPGSFTTAVLIQLAAFIAAVWWASRSLRLSSAVLAIGVVAAIVDWQASQLPAWPEALYFVTPIVWQVANAGLLINWAVSERRRARRETGVCASCGYDLRGLAVGSGGLVCPECGGKPTAVGGHDA